MFQLCKGGKSNAADLFCAVSRPDSAYSHCHPNVSSQLRIFTTHRPCTLSNRHCLPVRPCRSILIGLLFLSTFAAAEPLKFSLSAQTTQSITADLPVETPATHYRFLQAHFAVASESDFGPALAFYYERPEQRTNLFHLSAGRQVGSTLFGWPAEIVAYGSIQYFGEQGYQPDVIGTALYIKAYRQFRIGKSQFPIRFGLGEGLSYVSRIPIVEVEDFAPDSSAKLTNYLEWTLQTSLGHMLGHGGRRLSPGIKDIYIGYSVFHRSTVFGLFASKGGGVNFMGFGVELVLD